MFRKIFFLIIIIALAVFAYFNYPAIKTFLGNATTKDSEKIDASSGKDKRTDSSSISENTSEENSENEDSEEFMAEKEIKDEIDESGDIPNITAEDCDNECSEYKNNADHLRYCQDICGLVQPITDNCGEKQGMDKNYCFKNEAVSKTDLNICDSISDSKIKSSCKSRVMEDLLEKQ